MRRTLIGSLAMALVLLGCGAGGAAGPTGAGGGPTGAGGGATGPGATTPAANGAGSFCEAAFRLELADASNRQEIQAGLEAATPAGQEENVAMVRKFMERQAAGDDPYKDPTFLLEYDNAVKDLWRHCGRD